MPDLTDLARLTDHMGSLKPFGLAIVALVALAIMFSAIFALTDRSLLRNAGLGWLGWGLSLVAAVAAVALYLTFGARPELAGWSVGLAALGLGGLVVAGLSAAALVVRPPGYPAVPGGLWRARNARRIMSGRFDRVDPAWREWIPSDGNARPNLSGYYAEMRQAGVSAAELDEYLWTRPSRLVAALIVILAYAAFFAAVSLALAGIAAGVLEVGRQDRFTVDDAVLFATDQPSPATFETAKMHGLAAAIAGRHPLALRITGHTDGQGDAAYNRTLSLRRAQILADWLKRQPGLEDVRMAVEGRGESEPRYPEQGLSGAALEQARQGNRRVTIEILE